MSNTEIGFDDSMNRYFITDFVYGRNTTFKNNCNRYATIE